MFKTMLKRRTYNGNSSSLVHFMYSFKIWSDPGAFAFFRFVMHLDISSAVIYEFKICASSSRFILSVISSSTGALF